MAGFLFARQNAKTKGLFAVRGFVSAMFGVYCVVVKGFF
jgi:hypothetical protein